MTNHDLETTFEETPDHITIQRLSRRNSLPKSTPSKKIEGLVAKYTLPEQLGSVSILVQGKKFQIRYDHTETRSDITPLSARTLDEAELEAEKYIKASAPKENFYKLKGNPHSRNSGWLGNYKETD